MRKVDEGWAFFPHALTRHRRGRSYRSPKVIRYRQRSEFADETHEGRKILLKRHLKPGKTSPPVKMSLGRVRASILSGV